MDKSRSSHDAQAGGPSEKGRRGRSFGLSGDAPLIVRPAGEGAASDGCVASGAPSAAGASGMSAVSRRGKKRAVREYTLGEEVANSITHGIGAALAIAALVLLIVKAVGSGAGIHLFAALVYGISLLVEYLMSTLYHAIAHDGAKRVFKVLDHSCIYLLIAGSYTPYCLITLGEAGGIWLAAFVWAAALTGVACEAFWTFRPRWVSAVIYVLMGWCVVAFLPQLFELLPAPGFWLLAAGGVSYTVGAAFYLLKKVPYMHSVFHVFVLAGSVLQFLSVILFVI
ncbi:hemolysin III family protein [Adlercreutzia sp. ZJ176]|uniref:PAQR family membrane homeostasis protein TrhA n=1 Tax=unclassified Adlercreutzia TaxID=2636013 RepID=UPI00351A0338